MNENEIVIKIAELLLEAKKPDYLGDLIKIGLPLVGTILIAWIGYFTATRTAKTQKDTQLEIAGKNHESELIREYELRRAARYTSLIDKLDSFAKRLTSHTTNIKNYIEDQKSGETINSERLTSIEECESALYESFLDLLSAEAQLLVAGDESIHSEFRIFGETAQDVYKEVYKDNENLTTARIDDIMRNMREMRKDLLLKIGNAERKHNKAN